LFLLRRPQFSLLVALLLTATLAVLPSRAQMTNPPSTTATNDLSDASHFPGLDNLPGHRPSHIWNGLGQRWEQDHRHWKPNATNEVGAIVFLGESITEGWHSLARDFPNMKVANRGIAGDITSGVLYRLQADVLDLDPAGIVLLIGTNDIGDDSDPADVADNIRQILQAIKKFNPNLKVIVCKVMPRSDRTPGAYTAKIKQLNSLVENYVTTEPNFAICDTWSIYADDQGNPNPADFNADHLHLNPAGYAVWKTALDPVMAQLNFAAPKSP
jgi:lysophospholipase L1-like esterase